MARRADFTTDSTLHECVQRIRLRDVGFPMDVTPSRLIRVLVADDHTVVRKGVCALLATEPDIQVVGEAADGQDAIAKVQALEPDVILMDLVMPQVDGVQAIEAILGQCPGARILVLTSFGGDDRLRPAVEAGAQGYLLKDTSPQELIRAIHRVYSGQPSFPSNASHPHRPTWAASTQL